jgi:hypothetical protein
MATLPASLAGKCPAGRSNLLSGEIVRYDLLSAPCAKRSFESCQGKSIRSMKDGYRLLEDRWGQIRWMFSDSLPQSVNRTVTPPGSYRGESTRAQVIDKSYGVVALGTAVSIVAPSGGVAPAAPPIFTSHPWRNVQPILVLTLTRTLACSSCNDSGRRPLARNFL